MAPMAPQHSQHVQISGGQAGQMVTSPSHQDRLVHGVVLNMFHGYCRYRAHAEAAPSESKPAKQETAVKLHVSGQRRW